MRGFLPFATPIRACMKPQEPLGCQSVLDCGRAWPHELDQAWRLVQPPLKRRIEELKQEVRRLSGLKKLDLCSPKEVGDMLFQTLGLPVPSCAMRGPSRNPSTNNEVRCISCAAPVVRLRCICCAVCVIVVALLLHP